MKSGRMRIAIAVGFSSLALTYALWVYIEARGTRYAEMLASEDTSTWVSVLDPERKLKPRAVGRSFT